jgi:hypothetical protein
LRLCLQAAAAGLVVCLMVVILTLSPADYPVLSCPLSACVVCCETGVIYACSNTSALLAPHCTALIRAVPARHIHCIVCTSLHPHPSMQNVGQHLLDHSASISPCLLVYLCATRCAACGASLLCAFAAVCRLQHCRRRASAACAQCAGVMSLHSCFWCSSAVVPSGNLQGK